MNDKRSRNQNKARNKAQRTERKRKWFWLFVVCFSLCFGMPVQAEGTVRETEGEQEELLETFDFEALEEFLQKKRVAEGESYSFRRLVEQLMKGEFYEAFCSLFSAGKEQLADQMSESGYFLGQVLLIGLLGAVFANYAGIFSDSQIAEMGFYVTYLLMLTCLASSFLSGMEIAKELLENTIEFMQALIPAFFLSVSFAGGTLTSASGCSLMLVSIRLAQGLFLHLFFPMIRMYTLFVMAGHLVKEDFFSKATELLRDAVLWGVKTVTGVILGFHLLQGMVAPYADAVKNTPVRRLLQALPGVGQGAAALSQMILGSGVLIKNSIGAGAAMILFVLAALPLLQLLFLCVLYQGTAALLQPVCDKRMISCISAVGEGCRLLFAGAAAIVLLFLLSIAIVCMSSNTMYFSG